MSETARAEWAKRVERWKDSGLSAREFAAKSGLNASTLAYWSWKLGRRAVGEEPAKLGAGGRAARPRRRRRAEAKSASRFIEVPTTAVTTAAPTLELVLKQGVRVRVPEGFDEATLARIVRAVEAAS